MGLPIFHSQYTAAQIEASIGKTPRIKSSTRTWEIWNIATSAYVDTGVSIDTQLFVDNTLTEAGYAADAKVTGDKVGELTRIVSSQVVCDNLIGNEANKLYPVYIPPNTKVTFSTSDGQAFGTARHIQFLDRDGVQRDQFSTMPTTANKRTITTSSSKPATYYLRLSDVPRVPLMLVIGSVAADYVPYFFPIKTKVDDLDTSFASYTSQDSNGSVLSTTFVQGQRTTSGSITENTARCTLSSAYNVYPNDVISVSGEYTDIKFAPFIVFDDGTVYDDGWKTTGWNLVPTKPGRFAINVAKSNGTDAITPSDITLTALITRRDAYDQSMLQAMVDNREGLIEFSVEGKHIDTDSNSNLSLNLQIYYNNGFFAISGRNATAAGRAVRLTSEFAIGSSSSFSDLSDGLHLTPNKKYRITSKLVHGHRIYNGATYGVTVSVYALGGSSNIGTFSIDSTTVENEFVCPSNGIVNIFLFCNANSTFDDCQGYITLEAVFDTAETIKSYYEAEAEDTLAKVRAVNDEPSIVFPWVTDIHRFKASTQTFSDMVQNMRYLVSRAKCDYVLNTGDTIEGDQQQNTSLGQAYDSIAAMQSIGEPFFYVNGNHDNNPYISSGALVFSLKQIFGGFFAATKGITFNVNENGTDYYFDFANLGVRLISINSCNPTIATNYGFGNSTAAWLTNALNTEHTVILASHVSPIKEHVWNNINPGNADDIRSALSAFVAGGGKLIVLTGHSHIDAEWVNPYVEITDVCQKFEKADISTTQYQAMTGMIDGLKNPDRTENTETADAWTMCVYKPISDELDLIRFGAGTDRYIHCTSISSGTLTTKLSGAVSWSSSNNSVATVSNGTISQIGTGRCAVLAKDTAGNIEVWVVEVA